MIVDQVHLLVQAGNGGNGCESYYTRPDKKRIHNGGNGGDGGNVIFKSSSNAPNIGTLRYKQHVIAESGEHGGSNKKRGRDGEDLTILVPKGTRLYDREKKLLLRELMNEGDEVVVVEGGTGGSGNYGGKTATHGEDGAVLDLEVHARIQADAFFIGLPNAGKSTLLNTLTRAHAKQGSYPFTTRHPEVGVWQASEFEQRTLCELPSIYATSDQGRGLGTDFLKHLEDARFLVVMIDPLSQFAPTLKEGLEIVYDQLKKYSAQYMDLPRVVVVSKMDMPEVQDKLKEENFKPDVELFLISSQTGEGLQALKDHLEKSLQNA